MVSKTEPFGLSVSEYQRLTPYGRHSSCRLWRRILVTSGVKRWPTKARIVESVRGAKGGYRLRRAPSEIRLSEIIRLIDGPLAPFGDADQLRVLIYLSSDHSALYKVFLEVRDAAAKILENTTLADLISRGPADASYPKAINRKTGREN